MYFRQFKLLNLSTILENKVIIIIIIIIMRGILFWSPIQITNPAGQGLTSVNFGITKLSNAQRARLDLW